MNSPIIGISGNKLSHSVEAFYGEPVTYTPHGTVSAIKEVGGTPLVIPINEPSSAEKYISIVDKLLLTGGQDIAPDLYGEEPHPKLGETNKERDLFEISLIQEAMKQQKPIFAICRGMQLLNVALGGTLYQDLSLYSAWKIKHAQQPTQPKYATHTIKIEEKSMLGTIIGETCLVNSYHHQGIKDLSKDLVATAWAADGIIEGIEFSKNSHRMLGVQWHPELRFEHSSKELALFDYFVNKL